MQTYLEIADLNECLFVQYKPAYVTPARGWKRDEKLTITSVPRSSYFIDHLPRLWDFWARVCAFRAGILPLADPAARTIEALWRHHKGKNGATELKAKLAAVCFSIRRKALKGVYEAKEKEMQLQRPKECDRMDKPLVVCVKQADVAMDGITNPQMTTTVDHLPIKLTVITSAEDRLTLNPVPIKPKQPDLGPQLAAELIQVQPPAQAIKLAIIPCQSDLQSMNKMTKYDLTKQMLPRPQIVTAPIPATDVEIAEAVITSTEPPLKRARI